MSGNWVELLDLNRISDDDKHRILEYVLNKHSREKILEFWAFSRYTLHRLLSKELELTSINYIFIQTKAGV